MSLFLDKKGLTKVKRGLIGVASTGFLIVASSTWNPAFTQAVASSTEKMPMVAPTPASSAIATSVIRIMFGQRHYEYEGGFSYVPPVGWVLRELPGFKYKVAYGPQTGNIAPNMIFLDEVYLGSLDSYVSVSLANTRLLFPNLSVISREYFLTAEGKWGVKVVTQNPHYNPNLQQTLYFFASGIKKVVISYTRRVDLGQANDLLCDDSMKTFRFEPKTPQ